MSLQVPQPSSDLTSPTAQSQEMTKLSSRDTKKLISWVHEQYIQTREQRWRDERQWYLNLLFYFGKQNVLYREGQMTPVGRAFNLYTPPAPYYRSRPVINRIRPLVRTEMAKLVSQKPSASIIPASSEDRDLFAANAGEQIWDSLYRSKKIAHTIRRSVFWNSVTGNGFIKVYWDEDKEDIFSGQMGDMCFIPVTPFHILVPDLREEEIEDQPFVLHAQVKTGDEVSSYYGKEFNFESNKASSLEETYLQIMGIQEWKKSNRVLILEAWIKPGFTKLMPNGGLLTVAGDNIIQAIDGNPYEHGLYPFAKLNHIPTGKFYSDSTINDLIPLQRELNRTRGQIIEAKNRMAKPQLAAEIGSVDVTKMTSEPGQVILYRPGFNPPTPIPLQGLPSYVTQEVDRILADMSDISGQSEVSRGQAPPGVTAATALSYLQEQDDSKLSATYDSIEETVEKVAHIALSYVKQFWDTERQVKVTGDDGSFDVMAFQGSDLRGNTDIKVEAGSALPTSKAAKQAYIMDLMKMGFIDPQKGLEVLEIGGINKIYEQVQVDVRQAQRENLKMAQITTELLQMHQQAQTEQFIQNNKNPAIQQAPDGSLIDTTPVAQGLPPQPVDLPLIVPVNDFDDHRLHIERHNAYRKGQAYERLDDVKKGLFEAHVQAHVQSIMTGAMNAMDPSMFGGDPAAMQNAMNPESYKETQQNLQPTNGMQPGG